MGGGVAAPDVERLLLRGVLVVASLLVLVLLAGAARRVLDLPAVTPAAMGALWLIGFMAILGRVGLVAASAYGDRGAGQ